MLKPDMRMIWANSGDVVTPPESKIDLGWILEKPPSQYFNWHLNRTDRMLSHINRRGIPSWSSDTEYHTNGIASYVVGSNGRVYVSVAPSGNNTSPAKDPTTDTTREFWKPAFVGWDEAIPESQITGLTTKLNSKVDKTQRVNTSNGLSGGGALSGDLTIRPTYGTTANTVTQGNDPRLSNSREWSAATVGEAEAKAGTATTRRAWTAQRVHQAADGWYDKKFSTIVKNILSRSNAQQIRNDLQLGTAATRDVGESSGNVVGMGTNLITFGMGWSVGGGTYSVPSGEKVDINLEEGNYLIFVNTFGTATVTRNSYTVKVKSRGAGAEVLPLLEERGSNKGYLVSEGGRVFVTHDHSNNYPCRVFFFRVDRYANQPFDVFHNFLRTLSTTGNSTSYPMSQAATTAALNQKVSNTTSIIAGTGLEGGGTLSQNRTLSVKYGTTAGTSVEGNDSRVVNALQKDNNLGDVPNKILARQYLGLGSAATRDVGTESGNLMEVGAFGLGRRVSEDGAIWNESDKRSGFFRLPANSDANPFGTTSGASISWIGHGAGGHLDRLLKRWNDERYYFQHFNGTEWGALREILHTGNILKSTGDNDNFPMSQKAVTDAINNIIVAPIGMCYTQYPDTETPSSLFGGTWTLMFNTEGVFFRTEGQGASSFGSGVQGDAIRNITGWFNQRTYFSDEYLVGHNRSALFTSSREPNEVASVPNASGTARKRARLIFDASKVVPTSSENRPRNRTIRVWRKTSH